MRVTVEQVYRDATLLSESDRFELVDRLIHTLDSNHFDLEFQRTIQHRLDEIESGTVEGRPVEELLAKLRERYP